MEQKREIVRRYVSQGLKVKRAVDLIGISKGAYYYRPNGRPKGKRPSRYTKKSDGIIVPNEEVVHEIVDLISPEYNDYGYRTVGVLLQREGYKINPKKVHRLMKENQLLHPKVEKGEGIGKVFIKYTVPPLEHPFATVEVDIKYIHIDGENRNAYLITFFCTFSRFVAVWDLSYKMKSEQIIALLELFLSHPEVKGRMKKMILRTDNGPQFISRKFTKALKDRGIDHEFTHPGTPQQNGHIESFHSTVTRLICKRMTFESLQQARETFQEFFFQYNYTRVMKSLLYYPPAIFLKLWDRGMIGIKKDKNNKEIFFFREKPTPELEAGLYSEVLGGKNKNNIFDYSVLNTNKISPVL